MSGEGIIANRRHGLTMTKRLRRGFLVCPICNADAGIHDSDQPSPLVKDLWVGCTNVTCGHTWKAQIAFVYTISPSAIEHDIDLPQAPPEFVRHIYPAGPPGSAAPDPDPNQLKMFEEDEGAADSEPETGRHAA